MQLPLFLDEILSFELWAVILGFALVVNCFYQIGLIDSANFKIFFEDLISEVPCIVCGRFLYMFDLLLVHLDDFVIQFESIPLINGLVLKSNLDTLDSAEHFQFLLNANQVFSLPDLWSFSSYEKFEVVRLIYY